MQLNIGFQVVAAFVSLLFSQSAFAAPSQNQFWSDVRALVQKCSVQPVTVENGKKVYGALRSNCAEVQVEGSQARFKLGGIWYLASITDSADADGGDLNDVRVWDHNDSSAPAFAERHNALAFGDILVALAGGRVQSPEEDVQDSNSSAQ